jgi:hypothetical protein
MPGSMTTPRSQGARGSAPGPVAFRSAHGVGFSGRITFVAQWLAYALPCRRFALVLADADARLGADVVRYSFIAVDLHHLLLAGLPAHAQRNPGCRKSGYACPGFRYRSTEATRPPYAAPATCSRRACNIRQISATGTAGLNR